MSRARVQTHAGVLLVFAGLAVAWTWPLLAHVHDAIPGQPGDNFSFLWYLWWMRRALASADVQFFHTTSLFFPFGASIANNPHTALPAFVAATLFGHASIVTAQNLLILIYVFANMAVAYALAFDITADAAASLLAGVIFGLSPYVAAHLPGHFELMTVWTLPLFALFVRRAWLTGSRAAAVAAGAVAAATAYTSYYYFVYQAVFFVVFVPAWAAPATLTVVRRTSGGLLSAAAPLLAAAAAALAGVAVWVAATGGDIFTTGEKTISITRPQGPLTAMWAAALLWVACRWRVQVRARVEAVKDLRRRLAAAVLTSTVTLAGAAPLLWLGVRLMITGDYVTPIYFWRSAPRGVDLLAPLLGPPAHSLFGGVVTRIYERLSLDPIEAVGWLGVIPVVLLASTGDGNEHRGELRAWRWVVAVFAVWAAGPFLTIGGFDIGVVLPETLLRWVPFVANARMPGRTMAVVFLGLAVLVAMRVRSADGRLASPAWRCAAAAAIVAEFWVAPIPLTPIVPSSAMLTLSREPGGAVCEVPFGIGDGLTGTGAQDRRLLYDAIVHEHPVVGGFLGRMPENAETEYSRMAVVGDLLRLSNGVSVAQATGGTASPCRYLIVRQSATPEMRSYVEALPHTLIARDDGHTVYRLEP